VLHNIHHSICLSKASKNISFTQETVKKRTCYLYEKAS